MLVEYRVLICGGRDYNDKRSIYRSLDGLFPRPTAIIHGGASGADFWAGRWAADHDVPCEKYAVDHAIDGPWPAAGPRRNARMLEKSKPHMVVAFPGGRGTADMVRRARAAGCMVIDA